MITTKQAFFVDGKPFASPDEARSFAVTELIGKCVDESIRPFVVQHIIQNKDQLVAVLSDKPQPAKRVYRRKSPAATVTQSP